MQNAKAASAILCKRTAYKTKSFNLRVNAGVRAGGGAFANFALPGGRTFANPGANPELLTRTRFPIRI